MSADWSIETQPRPVLNGRRGTVLGLVLGLALVVGVVVELAPRVAVPAHVARVRVVNPTVYHLNVEVAEAPGGAWVDLTTVTRESTATVEQVLDQGGQWLFRFSYGGVDAGTVRVGRSALESAGWTVRAPDTADDRLSAAGLFPSAR
jgi:hypothetical protein